MKGRFSLLCMVFYFTVILIVTVFLRGTNDRIFYRLCVINAEQNRLRQQLWHKQLELEQLINPAAVLDNLGE